MQTTLDVMGQVCPFPLVEAKEKVKTIEVNDELVINFDCTQATESIPRWAAEEGLKINNFEQTGNAEWTITLQKIK